MSKVRVGPYSREEKKFIIDNAGKISHESIASTLGRNPDAVKRFIQKQGLKTFDSSYEYDLKATPYWPQAVRQFNAEELETMRFHWNETMKQFRGDVLHSEELQILDMCRLEVMTNRLLEIENSTHTNISLIEQDIAQEEKKKKDKSFEKLAEMKAMQASYYSSLQDYAKRYGDLLSQKNNIFGKLKATREQRIKEIESSKESLIGWLRNLEKNYEERRRLGIEMEKFRLAVQKEEERLSQYHEFLDGEVDQPLISPKSIGKIDE